MVTPTNVQNVHLSEIIDSAMDAIISINSDFRIIIFNRAAEILFGYPAEEMLGKTLERVLPEDIRSRHDEILRNFIATSDSNVKVTPHGKIRGLRSNGEVFPMEAAISKTESNEEIILTAILRDVSERKLFEERTSSLLKEKEFILKEIHHRVKNNLFTIFSLLQLQASEVNSPDAKEDLIDASGRVRSMITLYDKLYQKENDNQSVNLREYLPSLARDIVKIFPSPTPVQVDTQVDDITLDIKILSPLGIIINEFITNTMKYAFQHKDQTRHIKIQTKVESSKLQLLYEDNGRGMQPLEISAVSSGFGLQMVEALVAQMKGSLKIENENGTKISITFPI